MSRSDGPAAERTIRGEAPRSRSSVLRQDPARRGAEHSETKTGERLRGAPAAISKTVSAKCQWFPRRMSLAYAGVPESSFACPPFAGKTFTGTIARLDRSLDPKTRTMAVELDVANTRNELSPACIPRSRGLRCVPVHRCWCPRARSSLLPERTFVIRVRDGRAEWVNVRKGAATGDSVDSLGPLTLRQNRRTPGNR